MKLHPPRQLVVNGSVFVPIEQYNHAITRLKEMGEHYSRLSQLLGSDEATIPGDAAVMEIEQEFHE